jgi:hypothetical protein
VSLDPETIALGIRQPWVELILRGIKTLEVRSFDTPKRGTIYLYASKTLADNNAARDAVEAHALEIDTLPTGLLCGSVELADSRPATPADAVSSCVPKALLKNAFVWALKNPQRFETPQTVRFLPYGIWFYPYRRRNGASR